MTVRQLTDRLPITQSAVSQHLAVLRKAELVAFEPRGASNLYRIDPRGLGAIRGWLEAGRELDDERDHRAGVVLLAP